jgi:hypothetical protein
LTYCTSKKLVAARRFDPRLWVNRIGFMTCGIVETRMHKQPKLKLTHPPLSLRLVRVAVVTLVMFGAPALLRSETMSTRPAPSVPALTTNERLMQLVPAQVGKWKRHKLAGARANVAGVKPPTVVAEFRRAEFRVQVSVTQTNAAPSPVTPIERDTDEGSEKIYVEGGNTVRETLRRADGRADVALIRTDGVTVIAHSMGVAASELKAIAQGVKTAAR